MAEGTKPVGDKVITGLDFNLTAPVPRKKICCIGTIVEWARDDQGARKNALYVGLTNAAIIIITMLATVLTGGIAFFILRHEWNAQGQELDRQNLFKKFLKDAKQEHGRVLLESTKAGTATTEAAVTPLRAEVAALTEQLRVARAGGANRAEVEALTAQLAQARASLAQVNGQFEQYRRDCPNTVAQWHTHIANKYVSREVIADICGIDRKNPQQFDGLTATQLREQMQTNVGALRQDIATLRNEIQAKQQEIDQLQQTQAALAANGKNVIKLADHRKQITALKQANQEQLQAKGEEIAELQGERDRLQEEIRRMQGAFDSQQRQLTQHLQEESGKQIALLNGQLETLAKAHQEQIETRNAILEKMRGKLEKTKEDLAKSTQLLGQANSKLIQTSQVVETLEGEKKLLGNRIAELTRQIEETESRLQAAIRDKDDLVRDQDTKAQTAVRVGSEQIQKQLQAATATLAEKENALAAIQASAAQLNQKLQQGTEFVAKLERDNSNLKIELETLKVEKARVDRTAQDATATVDTNKDTLAAKDRELATLKSQLQTVQKEAAGKAQAEKTSADLQRQVDALTKAVATNQASAAREKETAQHLQKQVEGVTAVEQQVKAELAEAKKTVAALTDEKTRMASEAVASKQELERVNGQLSTSQERLRALETELTAKVSAVKTAEITSTKIVQEATALKQSLESTKTELAAKTTHLEDVVKGLDPKHSVATRIHQLHIENQSLKKALEDALNLKSAAATAAAAARPLSPRPHPQDTPNGNSLRPSFPHTSTPSDAVRLLQANALFPEALARVLTSPKSSDVLSLAMTAATGSAGSSSSSLSTPSNGKVGHANGSTGTSNGGQPASSGLSTPAAAPVLNPGTPLTPDTNATPPAAKKKPAAKAGTTGSANKKTPPPKPPGVNPGAKAGSKKEKDAPESS